MRRVVVVGGPGLFGREIARQLRMLGIESASAARSPRSPIVLDAENPRSIRDQLRPGDLVIDAAGPFQRRSTALVEAAITLGFDLVDINDNLAYAERTWALAPRFADAGIRVFPSASSVSAIAAATIRHADIEDPVRVTTFLAPASRHTANPGSALSLLQSVGRPVRTWRAGRLESLAGWSQIRSFTMPPPLGPIRGRLFESADAIHLPRIWPSLEVVEMFVDGNTPGVNTLLALAARSDLLRGFMERGIRVATWLARAIGSSAGGIGFEIEARDRSVSRFALLSGRESFIVAVAPAVLVARGIVSGQFPEPGIVPPDRHALPAELFRLLSERGIDLVHLA